MAADNRGSNEQRIIYGYLCQLYPTCNVIYEACLPDGTRYDCFVKEMGIVIEIDGRQHVDFIEHFHKDITGFKWQQFKDKKKDRKAEESGIKLIRIPQSECPKSKEELKAIIDSVPYPDVEYDFNSIMKSSENPALEKAREIRAKRYREQKQKGVVDRNATEK